MVSNSTVLIVGCRRSGTTLLRTILEGHPELLVHPAEPQFFLEIYRRVGFAPFSVMAAVEHILQHPYSVPGMTKDSLLGNDPPRDLRELTGRYLAAWSVGDNQKRVVLKDPALIFHLDVAEKLFPECVVIHVVRDPRANVSSQRQRWPQFSVWTCAMHWRRAVRAARNWAARRPEHYLEVQYESIVQHPEQTIRKLCRALSLPYSENLLTFRQSETVYEPDVGAKAKLFTSPDKSRMNLWRQWLTEDDIQLIETACSDEMSWWGYEPVSSKEPAIPLRLRMVKENIAYRVYRLGKRVKNVGRRLQPSPFRAL